MNFSQRLSYLKAILAWGNIEYSKREFRKLPLVVRRALLKGVNDYCQSLGQSVHATQNGAFHKDLSILTQSLSLRVASMLSKCFTSPEKQRLIHWALGKEFSLLSQKNILADECMDRILGLNERVIKHQLSTRNPYREEDIYLENPSSHLYTPYRMLPVLFKALRLKSNELFVDLGCGLGRVGIVLALLYPKTHFTGYELVKERANQARRAFQALGLSKRVTIQTADLSHPHLLLPRAHYYFLFNPFTMKTLRVVVSKLKSISSEGVHPIQIATACIGRPPRFLQRQDFLHHEKTLPSDKFWEGRGFDIFKSQYKSQAGGYRNY